MARIVDVFEFVDEAGTKVAVRIPETRGRNSTSFRFGSQVIVGHSQAAVFFRDGKPLDVLSSGRHIMTTTSVPMLVETVDKLASLLKGSSRFVADLYFVSLTEFKDLPWETSQPIIAGNPRDGIALVNAHGTCSFRVVYPELFITGFGQQRAVCELSDIQSHFETALPRTLSGLIDQLSTDKSALEIIRLREALAPAVRAKLHEHFEVLGLSLTQVHITSLAPSEDSARMVREMGLLESPPDGSGDDVESRLTSLRRQLATEYENLRLIEERIAEFVLDVTVDLQLVKEKRQKERRIQELEQRINELERHGR